VNSTTPGFLKLYREQGSPPQHREDRSLWEDAQQYFEQSLGVNLADQLAAGPPPAVPTGAVDLHDQAVRRLGLSMGQLWDELQRTREALWHAEAELATSVPLIARRSGENLAGRLESIVRGAAEAIGCTAAAMYVLDSGTTQLKLRTMWNLPVSRLADPARPLQGCTADLDALCGHAIVLEDVAKEIDLCPPEPCASAVCVPISSATTVLGTLWVYGETARRFTDQEVNVVEIVAGRVASELERELLLAKGSETTKLEKQLELAAKIQENQLPQIAPLLDSWQVSGNTEQVQSLGGDFHDWVVRDDERLLVAVADCLDGGVDASLCAAGVRAMWRALATHVHAPQQLLTHVNEQLWTSSAGDQYAHLFIASAEPQQGLIRYAAGGSIGAMWIGQKHGQQLFKPSLALGIEPQRMVDFGELILARGESLVVLTNGALDAVDRDGRPLDLDQMAAWVLKHPNASAGQIVDLVRDFIEAHTIGPRLDDRTVLALRRR